MKKTALGCAVMSCPPSQGPENRNLCAHCEFQNGSNSSSVTYANEKEK
jgi:hypothetical protein